MRIVFMGTPGFAVPALSALHKAGHDIALVVTRPDRPRGRGRASAPPPVKQRALELGLPVFQPEKIKAEDALVRVSEAGPDAAVVAAFGQILPKAMLELPPLGCLNVHASLLPAYRGAAPINWAIINGETVTGVTIMRMDAGMDTGDILMAEKEPIFPADTAGSLGARLSALGADMAVRAVADAKAGRLRPASQDSGKATYAPMLKKETGRVDWSAPASAIERLVRGLDPWPGAYTSLRGKTIRIWGAEVTPPIPLLNPRGGTEGGVIISSSIDGIAVATGGGVLVIKALQAEGGRRMSAREYLAGHKVDKGTKLE